MSASSPKTQSHNAKVKGVPNGVSTNGEPRLVALRGGLGAVPGVRLAGVHAGIKARKRGLALIAFNAPQVCASAITTNEIKAAPVVISAEYLQARGEAMQAVV